MSDPHRAVCPALPRARCPRSSAGLCEALSHLRFSRGQLTTREAAADAPRVPFQPSGSTSPRPVFVPRKQKVTIEKPRQTEGSCVGEALGEPALADRLWQE